MTVKELIVELESFDKDMEVVCLSDSGRILELRGAKIEKVFKGREDIEGTNVCAILEY